MSQLKINKHQPVESAHDFLNQNNVNFQINPMNTNHTIDLAQSYYLFNLSVSTTEPLVGGSVVNNDIQGAVHNVYLGSDERDYPPSAMIMNSHLELDNQNLEFNNDINFYNANTMENYGRDAFAWQTDSIDGKGIDKDKFGRYVSPFVNFTRSGQAQSTYKNNTYVRAKCSDIYNSAECFYTDINGKPLPKELVGQIPIGKKGMLHSRLELDNKNNLLTEKVPLAVDNSFINIDCANQAGTNAYLTATNDIATVQPNEKFASVNDFTNKTGIYEGAYALVSCHFVGDNKDVVSLTTVDQLAHAAGGTITFTASFVSPAMSGADNDVSDLKVRSTWNHPNNKSEIHKLKINKATATTFRTVQSNFANDADFTARTGISTGTAANPVPICIEYRVGDERKITLHTCTALAVAAGSPGLCTITIDGGGIADDFDIGYVWAVRAIDNDSMIAFGGIGAAGGTSVTSLNRFYSASNCPLWVGQRVVVNALDEATKTAITYDRKITQLAFTAGGSMTVHVNGTAIPQSSNIYLTTPKAESYKLTINQVEMVTYDFINASWGKLLSGAIMNYKKLVNQPFNKEETVSFERAYNIRPNTSKVLVMNKRPADKDLVSKETNLNYYRMFLNDVPLTNRPIYKGDQLYYDSLEWAMPGVRKFDEKKDEMILVDRIFNSHPMPIFTLQMRSTNSGNMPASLLLTYFLEDEKLKL